MNNDDKYLYRETGITTIDFGFLESFNPSLYQITPLDLSTARAAEKYKFHGSFLAITELTAGGSLEISFDDKKGTKFPFDSEQQIEIPFTSFYVTNGAQTGVSCKIITMVSGRFIPYYRTKAVAPICDDADLDVVSVGNTATLIIAANDLRRQGVIHNMSETKLVYVGKDNTVTTANGLPIYQLNERAFTSPFYVGTIYGIVGAGTAEVRIWFNTE